MASLDNGNYGVLTQRGLDDKTQEGESGRRRRSKPFLKPQESGRRMYRLSWKVVATGLIYQRMAQIPGSRLDQRKTRVKNNLGKKRLW